MAEVLGFEARISIEQHLFSRFLVQLERANGVTLEDELDEIALCSDGVRCLVLGLPEGVDTPCDTFPRSVLRELDAAFDLRL